MTPEVLLKSSTEPVQRFWWHWQNLNERKDGTTGSGLRHGRAWWHFPLESVNYGHSRTIELCWNLWSHFCGIDFDISDEDVTLMLAFPPVALWFSLSTNWAWLSKLLPRKPLNDTNYRDVIVIDERHCGVRIHGGSVWINVWSKRNETVMADPWCVRGVCFSINPFEPVHMRNEVRRAEYGTGTPPVKYSWVPFVGSWEVGRPSPLNGGVTKEPDGREELQYPYRYVRKNGEVQERIATVYVERRAWRPKCFKWTSLFERVRQSISIDFNEEVGEETGSWKGGCTGCGWEMLPGETALEALRRMESVRKF